MKDLQKAIEEIKEGFEEEFYRELQDTYSLGSEESEMVLGIIWEFFETKLTQLITSREQEIREEAVRKDREAIYRDIKSNYDISADEFYEQYLAQQKENK